MEAKSLAASLPPPTLISFSLSIVITGMGILMNLVMGYVMPWWAGLLFFFAVGFFIYLYLEWVVYRKLRNLYAHTQREIRKLKDLEAYRREFLGEVSHELKTPIFAIQGFIHTLIDGAMDDEKVRKKFLKKAMKNSDRLSSLVEDLLIITQAESGEMDIKIRKFMIYDLVIDVLDSLEYKFTKKKRNIHYRVEDNGHRKTYVLADRERIQQVLTNLIDNAIKYGNPDGEVVVQIHSKMDKVFLAVKDNGPGIEEEHLDKIFRRFYRVDKSRSRERGGTGLGLAICKHLISAHGEQINVQSTVGVGTTFTFSLKKATHEKYKAHKAHNH